MQQSSSVEWVGLVLLERVCSLRGKRICAWLRLLLVGFFGITLLRYSGLLLLVLLSRLTDHLHVSHASCFIGAIINLLISEPGSFDSIRADKEARADYNRARRDKRPKVFAHLPDLERQTALSLSPLAVSTHHKRLELGVAQRYLALNLVFGHVPQFQRALIFSFVAQVCLAQWGEEEVLPRPGFQVNLPVSVRVLEILLEAGVLRVVDQDHPVHVVRVAFRVLDELESEVEAGPEDEDGGGLRLEGARPIHRVRHHRLVRHLVRLARDRHRGTRSRFKVDREVRPCAVKDAHLFLDSASFVNDFLAYPKRVHLFIYLCVMYTINSVPRQTKV